MKKWGVLLACLGLGFPSWSEIVTSVHDGDSFHVQEFQQEVRLFGVDAPEVSSPPGVSGHHSEQPYGIAAQTYLRNLILGKQVELHCPHQASHKRPVCEVFLNGDDVARLLVRHGLAFNEPHYTQQYLTDETLAQTKMLGVWELPNGGERPWEWRKAQRQLIRSYTQKKAVSGHALVRKIPLLKGCESGFKNRFSRENKI